MAAIRYLPFVQGSDSFDREDDLVVERRELSPDHQRKLVSALVALLLADHDRRAPKEGSDHEGSDLREAVDG